ncbi:MAG TPA: F0F1 ATP synthase subunit delta [Dehalococcoidia bacterium]|nr:F0F1 ATP synthase subunit delta [Dehalococcoidia bacterium]
MPARSPSARRYAQAVFDLAVEQDAGVRWSGDLQSIADFAAEPDVARILRSARVPRAEKLRLLEAGLRGEISDQALNLVRLLNARDKLDLIADIQQVFRELLDEREGIAHATVTTAVPLSDDERAAVAARLSTITGKRVDVTPVVDESIIGGVVARIGDQVIDGSTKSRLIALKRSLEGAAR